MNESSSTEGLHDPYGALRLPDYRRFLIGNLLASLGLQMQKFTVGWEIVDRLERNDAAIAITWVGIVQVLPVIALAIPVGHIVDRSDRRLVIMFAASLIALSSLGLAMISFYQADFFWVYLCLLFNGIARAFIQPAKAAFLPQIVPWQNFSNAVTWNSSGFHLASIVGPALAGYVIALVASLGPRSWLDAMLPLQIFQTVDGQGRFSGPVLIYLLDTFGLLVLILLLLRVHPRAYVPSKELTTWKTLAAGLGFVWRTKLILGSITLDMFAVLLGGATALLPIYAKEILKIGPEQLGWLQAAPAIGAFLAGMVIAHRPPFSRAGPALLWSVAGFGLAIIVFGLSPWYWLSLAMLFLTGALDNVSVVVRHTLVQLLTPDSMRGRVAAVNSMFIGASNELGAAESGFVAYHFGPVFSVVSGGIGTLLVVGMVAWAWPEVRRYGRLGSRPESAAPHIHP